MSKRNFEGLTAKGTQNKKTRDSFNPEWLKVKVTTDTPDLKNVHVELSSIYKYSYENGLKCKICAACSSFKTNTGNEYATGKRWEAWKLDSVSDIYYRASMQKMFRFCTTKSTESV